MAGRPFLNVALPATATAAVAVVSYLLYKKTCPTDEYKMPLTNTATATTSDKLPSSPVSPPTIPSDSEPDPMAMTKPQTTPDSSPCESPPLAFYEVADPSITQRMFDISGDEGNNNIWTLERISDHLDMISEQMNPSLYVPAVNGSHGDVQGHHEAATNLWRADNEDGRSVKAPADSTTSSAQSTPIKVRPSEIKLQVTEVPETITVPIIAPASESKPQVTETVETKARPSESKPRVIETPETNSAASKNAVTTMDPEPETNLVARKLSKCVVNVIETGAVAAALMKSAQPSSGGGSTSVDSKSLLNLQLDEVDCSKIGVYEKLPQILPQVEAQRVDTNLMSSNPFAMKAPGQTGAQVPLVTAAFDSATHSPSEDMLESPCVSNYSDIHSEESSDSGKGGSDINMPAVKIHPVVYEFELPQDLCGLLIGQQGSTIKFIKNKTQANIYLKRHHYNSRLKLCTVTGSQIEVDAALQMIRNKFPLAKYPIVTLQQVNPQVPAYDTFPLPETMQLILPEGIMCDVYLSSLVSANHFFVQQTVHPTYPALSQLTAKMSKCYSKGGPAVPGSVLPSAICAAPVLGGWYRAQVTHVFNERECGVKYLDYGGYAKVPIASLKQIRGDFLTIPFQASECYLANVKPINDEAGWTIEAHQVFEELAQGQILQAQVVGYSDTGVPFVYLYSRQGVLTHFINRELVSRGVAMWYDHQV